MSSGSDWWDQRVRNQLTRLIEVLRPALLLDKLLEKGIITLEDWLRLRDLRTEADRARSLLCEIIPKSLESTLDAFCTVLKDTRGQEHVAALLERPSTAPPIEGMRRVRVCDQVRRTQELTTGLQTSEAQGRHASARDDQEQMICAPVASTRAREPDDNGIQTLSLAPLTPPAPLAAMGDVRSGPPSKDLQTKIIMVVDSECIEEVEKRLHVLEDVCQKHWKAELEIRDIKHLDRTSPQSQTRPPSQTSLSSHRSYYIQGKKLITIILQGVCQDGFKTTSFYSMLKAYLRLHDDEIEILDVPSGSVMVVMRLSVRASLDLLCQFDKMKEDFFPDLHPDISRVDIRIGGLPALSGEIIALVPKKKEKGHLVQVHVKYKGTSALSVVDRKITGAQLKNQLEAKFLVASYSQRLLIYKDSTRVLSNFHSLWDYDIGMTIQMELLSCSTLYLGDKEFVLVRYPSGDTVSVQLDLCDTVMEIKDMLGSPNCELVSASNRRTLVDSETSKEVIPNDSVLFLVPETAKTNFNSLFVRRLTGTTIEVPVPSLDINVESFMASIQHREGIPMEVQSIVFAGKILEPWNTLASYKICNGSILHLICKSRKTTIVFCKKSDDTLEKLDISKEEKTVGGLKMAIEAKTGISAQNQQLCLYGQPLEDVRTLQHYGIWCWTTLELKETKLIC